MRGRRVLRVAAGDGLRVLRGRREIRFVGPGEEGIRGGTCGGFTEGAGGLGTYTGDWDESPISEWKQ